MEKQLRKANERIAMLERKLKRAEAERDTADKTSHRCQKQIRQLELKIKTMEQQLQRLRGFAKWCTSEKFDSRNISIFSHEALQKTPEETRPPENKT